MLVHELEYTTKWLWKNMLWYKLMPMCILC
jgi:hypothetical protein